MSEPFIAWKPDHVSIWADSDRSRNGPLILVHKSALKPEETLEHRREVATTAAVNAAANEYGVFPVQVRRPSNDIDIKRARAMAAHALFCQSDLFSIDEVMARLNCATLDKALKLVRAGREGNGQVIRAAS